VVASLVQREASLEDFPKVARVIYNRLAEHRKLEFDSTVNYPLDRQEVATTDGDRRRPHRGTPMRPRASGTPICSPGDQRWPRRSGPNRGLAVLRHHRYAGNHPVHQRYDQHLANIELAKHKGVLDSAR